MRELRQHDSLAMASFMKEIARRVFSLDQRQKIAGFRKRANTTLTISPYLRLIKLLPQAKFVRVKEGMVLVGKLDYKHTEILMNVDTSVQLMRLRSCAKEPETIEWIETHFKPGEVLYDIGANVGSYSFVSDAVMRGQGITYAFEPSFSTFAALSQNILLNHCDGRIIPLQVALSNETKLLTFNYSNLTAGSSMHSVGEAVDMYGKPFRPTYVQPLLSYRLDDLIDEFSLHPPNHIKIDTDGAELKILRGAERTLERSELRTLFIEVNEKLPTCSEMLEYIKSKGFVLRAKYPAGVSDGFFNYLFVRPQDS